jgi:hypothetical protein
MTCKPTLTEKEFSDVHNALCYLRFLQNDLTPILNETYSVKLSDIIKLFEGGLAGAYAQDNASFDQKSEYFENIADGYGFDSTWSIYEISCLNEIHPFPKNIELKYRDHWGPDTVIQEIPGNTWLDLWRAADEAIRKSEDGHHIFIEGFELSEDGLYLELSTGS